MIKFGTSGFRAIMSENFTKENVQRIAYGLCKYAEKLNLKNPSVVIGFDNRFMGDMFAKWAIEVLATKFKIKFYVKSVPTPVISFDALEYDFGMMITSSHNPFYYNGIKLFKKGAYECEDEETDIIAKYANDLDLQDLKIISYTEALEKGKIEKSVDAVNYKQSVLKNINIENVSGSKLKVLINPMYGSATTILKDLCETLNLKKVEFMKDTIDHTFGNSAPVPYARNLKDQADRVVAEKFDVGFALDGDGDRFTLIDNNGNIYDCGYVAPLIYDFLLQRGKKGGIVKNIAFSSFAKKVADYYNEPSFDSKVGFKCIGKILRENDCILGAESNGIALKEHINSKDGIIACALVLDMLIQNQKSFGELLNDKLSLLNFKSFVVETEYKITPNKKRELQNFLKGKKLPEFEHYKIINVDDTEGRKLVFENDYWCMMRLSGTEPVMRLFAEMENEEECQKVIKDLEVFLDIKN